jgi:site-specific DNA-methyltransferase (adenine-specific)
MTEIIGKATLHNVDCMEYMKSLPDNAFDLAIVDPPYRNQNENAPTQDMRNNRFVKGQGLGSMPTKDYFNELYRVSKNQIIWGANNFQLPQFKGFIVWKKLTISQEFTMSMAEIASISEDLGTVSKIFELQPQGSLQDPRIHPTQKPIKLYEWLLTNYAKQGDKILDTHLGSGSHAVACNNLGFELTACELDKDYYEASIKRIQQATAQERLFV